MSLLRLVANTFDSGSFTLYSLCCTAARRISGTGKSRTPSLFRARTYRRGRIYHPPRLGMSSSARSCPSRTTRTTTSGSCRGPMAHCKWRGIIVAGKYGCRLQTNMYQSQCRHGLGSLGISLSNGGLIWTMDGTAHRLDSGMLVDTSVIQRRLKYSHVFDLRCLPFNSSVASLVILDVVLTFQWQTLINLVRVRRCFL